MCRRGSDNSYSDHAPHNEDSRGREKVYGIHNREFTQGCMAWWSFWKYCPLWWICRIWSCRNCAFREYYDLYDSLAWGTVLVTIIVPCLVDKYGMDHTVDNVHCVVHTVIWHSSFRGDGICGDHSWRCGFRWRCVLRSLYILYSLSFSLACFLKDWHFTLVWGILKLSKEPFHGSLPDLADNVREERSKVASSPIIFIYCHYLIKVPIPVSFTDKSTEVDFKRK